VRDFRFLRNFPLVPSDETGQAVTGMFGGGVSELENGAFDPEHYVSQSRVAKRKRITGPLMLAEFP